MRWKLVASALPVVVTAMFSASLVAQSDGNGNAKKAPGIAVGKKVPAFKLNGYDGKEYALGDLLKKGKVALVFFRSAEW